MTCKLDGKFVKQYKYLTKSMRHVCLNFAYSSATLLLSKAMFDSFVVSSDDVHSSLTPEVAVTCMMIASKLYENEPMSAKTCCDLLSLPENNVCNFRFHSLNGGL